MAAEIFPGLTSTSPIWMTEGPDAGLLHEHRSEILRHDLESPKAAPLGPRPRTICRACWFRPADHHPAEPPRSRQPRRAAGALRSSLRALAGAARRQSSRDPADGASRALSGAEPPGADLRRRGGRRRVAPTAHPAAPRLAEDGGAAYRSGNVRLRGRRAHRGRAVVPGAGAPPQVPTCGNVIAEGRTFFQVAFWMILFPGARAFGHGALRQPARRRAPDGLTR